MVAGAPDIPSLAKAASHTVHATAPSTPAGVEPELALEPSAPSIPPPAAASSRFADTAPTASPVTATAPTAPVVAVEPVPTEVASAPDGPTPADAASHIAAIATATACRVRLGGILLALLAMLCSPAHSWLNAEHMLTIRLA